MNPINPADDDMTAPTYEQATPVVSRATRLPIDLADDGRTAPTYEQATPVVSRLGAPVQADDDMTAPSYERATLVVSRAARLGGRIAPLASSRNLSASRTASLGVANGANQRAARLGIGSALGSRAARLGLAADPVEPGDQEKSA